MLKQYTLSALDLRLINSNLQDIKRLTNGLKPICYSKALDKVLLIDKRLIEIGKILKEHE
jgi:hypothetical protein